jgi:hypothetical protein
MAAAAARELQTLEAKRAATTAHNLRIKNRRTNDELEQEIQQNTLGHWRTLNLEEFMKKKFRGTTIAAALNLIRKGELGEVLSSRKEIEPSTSSGFLEVHTESVASPDVSAIVDEMLQEEQTPCQWEDYVPSDEGSSSSSSSSSSSNCEAEQYLSSEVSGDQWTHFEPEQENSDLESESQSSDDLKTRFYKAINKVIKFLQQIQDDFAVPSTTIQFVLSELESDEMIEQAFFMCMTNGIKMNVLPAIRRTENSDMFIFTAEFSLGQVNMFDLSEEQGADLLDSISLGSTNELIDFLHEENPEQLFVQ